MGLYKQGFVFTKFQKEKQSPFDQLFTIFKELITHTSGDFDEAIDWLRELDKEYQLTSPEYTIEDFIEDLKKRGYIREEFEDGAGDDSGNGSSLVMAAKLEQALRKNALEQLFGKLKKSQKGNHSTNKGGVSDDASGDFRGYTFGDAIEQISLTESLKSAQINNGIGDFSLQERDLIVEETYHKVQMSTVLMIDISHSMILYGEDRITPAKKVAMALAELITSRYPKDTLDVIVFGNDSWPIKIKDIPYLKVGPYHTNTVAGLSLAMDILRRKRNSNKQIFMITDGKPSCVREQNGEYYKNSNGLDPYIVDKCYSMAGMARKMQIPITTFMIAQDYYLQHFIEEFTKANKGKAFYTGIEGLGEMILRDFEQNRIKRLKG
ncbi:MAG: hypothetical protein P8O20_06290 [Bacteroidia bacterium]|nr:hypothetical protein [Bacteroidia bacterium]